jgi:hypothetical protein
MEAGYGNIHTETTRNRNKKAEYLCVSVINQGKITLWQKNLISDLKEKPFREKKACTSACHLLFGKTLRIGG